MVTAKDSARRNRNPDPSRPRRALSRLALSLAMISAASGCQAAGGKIGPWKWGKADEIAREITPQEYRSAVKDADGGPAESRPDRLLSKWMNSGRKMLSAIPQPLAIKGLHPNGWQPSLQEAPDPDADRELAEAETLFRSGDLKQADSRFGKIAYRRKGTSWGEKAQYFLAETQFQRGQYMSANDNYEELAKSYPGTKYLDKIIERQYAIGDFWITAAGTPRRSEAAKSPDSAFAVLGMKDPSIAQASYDPSASGAQSPQSPVPSLKIPTDDLTWRERFRGKLPLFDWGAYGIQTLERALHHDPTGPIADDVLMRIADHHFAKADYDSAIIYYDQLASDLPKSPLRPLAMLASIDSKIKAYVGPDYEGSGLERAREQIRQAQLLFAENPQVLQALYSTLDQIKEAEAERAYRRAAYYHKIGKYTSAEYMYGMVPRRWPKSPWAQKAKDGLAQIAKAPRIESAPSKIMTQPGAEDPFGNGIGSNGFSNTLTTPF